MLGRTAGGLLRFLSAWEFESRVFPEIPKFGGFASPARYFYFTLSDFSNMRLLFLITLIFLLCVQKSRTSVRDFCLHLFCQCKLVRLTGVEPVRPSGHKHLKLASLPIPAQPQSAVLFRPLAYYSFLDGICQRVEAVFLLFFCFLYGDSLPLLKQFLMELGQEAEA